MIEAKLLVDRLLKFDPTPSRIMTGLPPAFVPVICPPMTIQESVRQTPGGKHNPFRNMGGVRVSTVAAGSATAANKVHRNFKWLPWYEGDISETPLDRDVLTGPMSGCILVSYMRAGVRTVGHIGTVTVTEKVPASVNTNVKAVWTTFAATQPAGSFGGFNPVAITVPMHPPAQTTDATGQTWGLFTTTGQYYAVQVWTQRSDAKLFRVAAIHLVPSMTRAELLAI